MIKITFCDINEENLEPFRSIFKDINCFCFVKNHINSIEADCIVSPGNSYGIMDGGVDRAINYCCNGIGDNVQKMIELKYFGEQPVGTCEILTIKPSALQVGKFRYLAHCPTMRVPKDVSKNDNAYIAFRALLISLFEHNVKYNDIKTVVMTPFCCGAGKMNPEQAALQMKLAYDMILTRASCTWDVANNIESKLNTINSKKN